MHVKFHKDRTNNNNNYNNNNNKTVSESLTVTLFKYYMCLLFNRFREPGFRRVPR